MSQAEASIPAGVRERPWLFEMYPDLADRIPWTPLVHAPTPVSLLETVSKELGREVWVKRDDLTSPEYGGNKPRKLEFILPDAVSKGKSVLVTGGGIGTNHGLATAYFARKFGLKTTLCLFAQPVTGHVRRNLKLFHALGAEMTFAGGLSGFIWRHYCFERVRRPGAYFVPPGGSSPVGTLGYVDAALELARQVEAGEVPEPEVIFTAVGSSGTMAGLLAGFRLAGLKTRVIGVRVATPLSANRMSVAGLAMKTMKLMNRCDTTVPVKPVSMGEVRLITGHYGAGYGHPTNAGRAAARLLADAEGIRLDPTYTAKVVGALMEHVRTNSGIGPILYWHTFSSADLSPMADEVDEKSLPPKFHRFFEGEAVV